MEVGKDFTIIEHGHKQFRIATGFDNGAMYKKGDTIHWLPNPKRVGVGIDGCYVAFDTVSIGEVLIRPIVVIVDCVIVHIEPVQQGSGEYDDIEAVMDAHARMEQIWPKTTPARELWTEEAWIAKEAQTNKIKKAFRRVDSNQ